MIHYFSVAFAKLSVNKRMIWLYFLMNFLFALVAILPLRAVAGQFLGASTILAKGFSTDFLADFILNNDQLGQMIVFLFIPLAILYWLVNLFFSGGALAIFIANKSYDKPYFWGNAAYFFSRISRLFLLVIVVFILLFLLELTLVPLRTAIYGEEPSEAVLYWFQWIKMGLRYFYWILGWVIFDYARIILLKHDMRSATTALLKGIGFTFHYFHRTFVVALVAFVLGIIGYFLLQILSDVLTNSNVALFVILLILQQVYMLWRMALKLFLFAAETEVYHDRQSAREHNLTISQPELVPATIPSL